MSEVIFKEATLDELLEYLATTEEAAVEEVRKRIAELEQQLAELREAARELTLPIRVVCCHCSQSTMWIPDTPEALLPEEGK